MQKSLKRIELKALKVPNGDNIFSKREMKRFEDYGKKIWTKRAWIFQMKPEGLKGPLTKFFEQSD